MSKECKHEEWNPCGNDFYSCRKCGVLRTSQQVNLYEEKDKKIADLEAKLSESKEKVKAMETLSEMVGEDSKLNFRRYIDTLEKNEQLEQQLAEKDKEIEDLKIDLEAKDFNINTLMEQRKRKQKFYNQDKISFCIEQLEKVKEIIKLNYNNMFPDFPLSVEVKTNINIIDNQIEELKKENV